MQKWTQSQKVRQYSIDSGFQRYWSAGQISHRFKMFSVIFNQQETNSPLNYHAAYLYHQNVGLLVLPLLYVWARTLSTVLSIKLMNMHKSNYRSGLLSLLGAGVGGGGSGRWTLVTFGQSTTEVEDGVQRGTRVWPPTRSRGGGGSKEVRVIVKRRAITYPFEGRQPATVAAKNPYIKIIYISMLFMEKLTGGILRWNSSICILLIMASKLLATIPPLHTCNSP